MINEPVWAPIQAREARLLHVLPFLWVQDNASNFLKASFLLLPFLLSVFKNTLMQLRPSRWKPFFIFIIRICISGNFNGELTSPKQRQTQCAILPSPNGLGVLTGTQFLLPPQHTGSIQLPFKGTCWKDPALWRPLLVGVTSWCMPVFFSNSLTHACRWS